MLLMQKNGLLCSMANFLSFLFSGKYLILVHRHFGATRAAVESPPLNIFYLLLELFFLLDNINVLITKIKRHNYLFS